MSTLYRDVHTGNTRCGDRCECDQEQNCCHRKCKRSHVVIIVLIIGLLLGLTGFLVWWFVFREVGSVSVTFVESTDTPTGASRRLLGWGAANATELISLRYAIDTISLATSLTAIGSGHQVTGASWMIFRGTDMNEDYNSFDSTAAHARGADNDAYIDLMSVTQRALMSANTQPLLASQADKDYNFIVITWKRPIWVQAQVRINDTHTAYSKNFSYASGACGVESAGDCVTHTDQSLWTPPAQLVPLELNNGGAWARLAQPFRPSQDKYRVVIAFNPDGLVTAAASGLDTRSSGLEDPAGNRMRIPFLALNPIPVRVTQLVWKESYVLDIPTALCIQNANQVRVELYYVEGEEDQVRAVDAMGLYEPVPRYTSWVPQTFYLTGVGAGPYIFKDWSEAPFISEFYRTNGTTALFHSQCGGSYNANQTDQCCVSIRVNVTHRSTTHVVV